MDKNIRNFCIIAHIDHGKSTLADRFLELTGTISERDMKDQVLDTMDLEREKGITIKLQPIRMQYQAASGEDYVLNLIDTPGHMDFGYEVSRSIACVEGAILIVDATQGIQAQTLVNLRFAQDQNLKIIPVMNKIDLPTADTEKVRKEIITLLQCEKDDILEISAKTGQGVAELLEEVVSKFPSPPENQDHNLNRALIFDSVFDEYQGIISYVRVFDGSFKRGDKIKFLGSKAEDEILEVGYFRIKREKTEEIKAGDIAYIITGQRNLESVRVGDTISFQGQNPDPLPGYKVVKPMVYAGIYSQGGDRYEELREAVEKIKLNDSSIEVAKESSPVFGFGFRCGFLGLLHLDIFLQRLEREFDLDLVVTIPSVAYKAYIKQGGAEKYVQDKRINILKDEMGNYVILTKPSELDLQYVEHIQEPIVKMDIITPAEYMGSVMGLADERRGVYQNTEYLDNDLVVLQYEIPLSPILVDFYDKLKSVSRGYASLNYEFLKYDIVDVIKLDVHIAEEQIEALSSFVYRDEAYRVGKSIVEKLKESIPRQQFVVKIQAAIGGKIIAAERLSALRKDVTSKLYGGDVSRKKKLLQKQKKGKKRMQSTGKVALPQDVYLSVLKRD
ncbi:translation elongation factor 4 [bacterium]|nr:translation elongation factor 4 [bacterium]